MVEQNTFAGMMGGAGGKGADNQPVETAESERNQTKPAVKLSAKLKPKGKRTTVKSKDPGYVQMGLYRPENLHQRMKAGAAVKTV